MNERIKELAKQAGMEPEDGVVWWVSDGDLEKFTDLVVLECARVVKASSPNGMIGVNAIRIHFGVEP